MKTLNNSALGKTLVAVAAAAAFAATIPATASARDYNDRARPTAHHQQMNWGASRQIDGRIQNLDFRIDQGVRARQITRTEAKKLNRQLNQISQLKRQYERSGRGLTQAEARTLNLRLDRLSASVRSERWAYNGR